jgi:hypothetical protein
VALPTEPAQLCVGAAVSDLYTRNPHCSNCGSIKGGPMGHEISECTWDSVNNRQKDLPPVRDYSKPRTESGPVAERRTF